MVLFVINALLLVYTLKNDAILPQTAMEEIIDLYISSPSEIDKYYQQIIEFQRQQSEIAHEHFLNGEDYVPLVMNDKYSNDSNISDLELLSQLYTRIDYIDNYKSNINGIIQLSKNTLNEFDVNNVDNNSYAYKYQLNIISKYTTLFDEVKLGLEYNRGWDIFFKYTSLDIFVFLSILILSSSIFTYEKKCGTLLILKCTKHGREKLSISKSISLIFSILVLCFLFIGSTWLIILTFCGYSNINNAIQIFNDFAFCPYILTIGQYLLLFLSYKLLSYVVFSFSIIILSIFFYNIALSYISGVCIYAINFYFNLSTYSNHNNPIKYLNLVSVASPNQLFERYRALNINNNVIDYNIITIIIYILIIFISWILVINIYSSRNERSIFNTYIVKSKSKNTARFNNHPSIFFNNFKHKQSLLIAENHKTLVASKLILLVVFFFILKVLISINTLQPIQSYAESTYYEYMSLLAGANNEDKMEYLDNERSYINDIISRRGEVQNSYISGNMIFEEYSDFLDEYNYAYSRNPILSQIEHHAGYIDLIKSDKTQPWYVYDTGWKKLFFGNFDWTLYILLIILFSGVFVIEYEGKTSAGGFSQILRVTKNGRFKTFSRKYLSSILIGTILTIIWNVIDLLIVITLYDLPLSNAPVTSIESLQTVNLDISIWQYVILFYFIRVAAVILFIIIECSMSALLKKYITIITVMLALTALPSLLKSAGFSIFNWIDYIALMKATPMLLQGRIVLIYILLLSGISFISAYFAERSWSI